MTINSDKRLIASQQKCMTTYEIGIEGRIPSYWPDYLNATVVLEAVDASHIMTTILRCEIRDQAQLIGILNLLSSWDGILVWLKRLDAD
jgi:hypothetical protein